MFFIASDSDFSIHNIPFGIAKLATGFRAVTALGEFAISLDTLQKEGLLEGISLPEGIFCHTYLNEFIGLGKEITGAVRSKIQELYRENKLPEAALLPLTSTEMALPVFIRDYTDFYSSEEHATNVGIMFRGKENALMPNWKHLPVGYHGRASSIVISGTPLHRPMGQTRPDDALPPVFGASKQVDFELEMGFVIGKETSVGDSVSTQNAEEYIFGLLLFNDWSARDIQKWEYVPLGPFLGKNFGSSLSPWIVTLEALEPFRVAGPVQDPTVLPYLQYKGDKNYDIHLEVLIQPENAEETSVSHSNHKFLYWNMAQQLAHHTVNGCNLNIGDLMASGTISGPTEDSYGSMLELAWKGTKPLKMKDGSERKFILDNDTVIIRGYCQKADIRVGFGEVKSKILPAK